MIFIDTGAFFARYYAADQHHTKCVNLWERLLKAPQKCFTSNFVIDEVLTLLGRRTDNKFAAERARNMLDSNILTILRPSHDVEYEALDLFEKYADQKVSFTDCTSFVLMRKHRITKAFSFDRHFSMAGFELWK